MPVNDRTDVSAGDALALAQAVRSALRAARRLGPGYATTRTAGALGRLAADVDPGEAPDLAMAAEALAALEDVLALAPEAARAGKTEAEVTTAIAGALARHRIQVESIQGVTVTGAAALHGGAAWEVLHWMLRARGGQHRRLRARMVRPEGVPPQTWTRWGLVLRSRDDWDERRAALAEVRAACPAFLTGEPDMGATRAWMAATGGAAAMLLETGADLLLAVLVPDAAHGEVRPWVVLMPAGQPGVSLPELHAKLRAPFAEGAAEMAHDEARAAVDESCAWCARGCCRTCGNALRTALGRCCGAPTASPRESPSGFRGRTARRSGRRPA